MPASPRPIRSAGRRDRRRPPLQPLLHAAARPAERAAARKPLVAHRGAAALRARPPARARGQRARARPHARRRLRLANPAAIRSRRPDRAPARRRRCAPQSSPVDRGRAANRSPRSTADRECRSRGCSRRCRRRRATALVDVDVDDPSRCSIGRTSAAQADRTSADASCCAHPAPGRRRLGRRAAWRAVCSRVRLRRDVRRAGREDRRRVPRIARSFARALLDRGARRVRASVPCSS